MYALFGIGNAIENAINDALKNIVIDWIAFFIKILYDIGRYIAQAGFVVLQAATGASANQGANSSAGNAQTYIHKTVYSALCNTSVPFNLQSNNIGIAFGEIETIAYIICFVLFVCALAFWAASYLQGSNKAIHSGMLWSLVSGIGVLSAVGLINYFLTLASGLGLSSPATNCNGSGNVLSTAIYASNIIAFIGVEISLIWLTIQRIGGKTGSISLSTTLIKVALYSLAATGVVAWFFSNIMHPLANELFGAISSPLSTNSDAVINNFMAFLKNSNVLTEITVYIIAIIGMLVWIVFIIIITLITIIFAIISIFLPTIVGLLAPLLLAVEIFPTAQGHGHRFITFVLKLLTLSVVLPYLFAMLLEIVVGLVPIP
jgi:hypothetical protein